MKIEKFNDFLALMYLLFMLVWMVGAVFAVMYLELTKVEILGLGTATGILLAILKDVFQFYFRVNKPPEGEKH